MLKSARHILFESTDDKNGIEENYKLSRMKKEEVKLERALDRLQDLYLFDDHSMSEKTYLIKKKSISDKLKEINAELSKEKKDSGIKLAEYDLEFIKKATQYLISENLNKDNEIDYNEMIKVIDKKLMKQFIDSIVKKVNMDEDRKVHSIEFVNCMEHVFVHRD